MTDNFLMSTYVIIYVAMEQLPWWVPLAKLPISKGKEIWRSVLKLAACGAE